MIVTKSHPAKWVRSNDTDTVGNKPRPDSLELCHQVDFAWPQEPTFSCPTENSFRPHSAPCCIGDLFDPGCKKAQYIRFDEVKIEGILHVRHRTVLKAFRSMREAGAWVYSLSHVRTNLPVCCYMELHFNSTDLWGNIHFFKTTL